MTPKEFTCSLRHHRSIPAEIRFEMLLGEQAEVDDSISTDDARLEIRRKLMRSMIGTGSRVLSA